MRHGERAAFWHTARTNKGVSLLTSTGMRNMTRVAEYQGMAGNMKEESWQPGHHKCCGSRVSWRHKNNCPNKVKEN